MTARGRLLGAFLVALAALLASPARAEVGPRRVLDSLEVERDGHGWRILIRFGTPVRYLRHAPTRHGDTVQVQVSPIALSPLDAPAFGIDETLPAPPQAPVPLVEVTYEGSRAGGRFLVVRFSRALDFEVEPGRDFRSLALRIPETPRAAPIPTPPPAAAGREPPAPPPPAARAPTAAPPSAVRAPAKVWAVQLAAGPAADGLPQAPRVEDLAGARAYVVQVDRDGQRLHRLRVGPFATREDAEAARRRLAASFPGAFVADASSDRVEAPVLARGPAPGPLAAPPPRPGPPLPEPVPDADLGARSDSLMEAGRAAMTAGDLDQAIRVFTKVQGLPEHANSPAARELLGLARERRGQLAHAKAEYQDYLARYPDGEGAARVRQRLDALLTAQAKLPPRPGQAVPGESADRPVRVDVLGGTSTEYRREVRDSDATGRFVADSSLFSDATFVTRMRTPHYALRGQAAGSYLLGLPDSETDSETRLSSLFLEAKQADGPWASTVGRQPGNSAGLLSRFDGLRASRRVSEHWRVGVLGGAPVEYWSSDRVSVEMGRYLYGVSLDAERLFEKVDGQLFAIQQRTDGMLDRSAVGAELRYAADGRFAAAFLDYDLYYASLNTALLLGNWQVAPRTNLNFYADYRNSPILTTTNAIIGQDADGVGDLQDAFSRSEIESLAEDRTARSALLSLGGTQQLGDRLQAGLDVSISRLSGTPASGGVEATEGTGWELSVFPQLIATGLLRDGDVGTLGVRWFDGSGSDTWSLIVVERFPLTRTLRLLPRLRVDWRTAPGSDEFALRPDDPDATLPAVESATRIRDGALTLRPFLGAEYRLGRVTLGSDCGIEWTTASFGGGSDEGDEFAYILTFGLRYDF